MTIEQQVMIRYPKTEQERKCAAHRQRMEALREQYRQRLMAEKTIGEQRVRIDFNPSADSAVDQIKQKTAELINLCEELKAKDPRLASIAQTQFEDAAMWAVKAATA